MIQFPFQIQDGRVAVETGYQNKVKLKVKRVLKYSVRDLPFDSVGAGITSYLFSIMPDKSTQSMIREMVTEKITGISEVESANVVFQKESKNSYKMVIVYKVNGETQTLDYKG